MPKSKVIMIGLVAFVVLAAAISVYAASGASFGPPVQVTPDPGKGYEPSGVTDRYGNIFATAHKENYQLILGPDPNSPTYTRSMSWAWTSTNGGKTFSAAASNATAPPKSARRIFTARLLTG